MAAFLLSTEQVKPSRIMKNTSVKIIIAGLLLLLFPKISQATGFIPDRIYINGEKWSLYDYPIWMNKEIEKRLEEYLEKDKKGAILSWSLAGPGYICTWSIENDKLYLKEVEAEYCDTINGKSFTVIYPADSLKGVFKGQHTKRGIRANWVNNNLRAGYGPTIWYAHMGFAINKKYEMHINCSKGKIKDLSLRKYRHWEKWVKLKGEKFSNRWSDTKYLGIKCKSYITLDNNLRQAELEFLF